MVLHILLAAVDSLVRTWIVEVNPASPVNPQLGSHWVRHRPRHHIQHLRFEHCWFRPLSPFQHIQSFINPYSASEDKQKCQHVCIKSSSWSFMTTLQLFMSTIQSSSWSPGQASLQKASRCLWPRPATSATLKVFKDTLFGIYHHLLALRHCSLCSGK